MFSIVQIFLQIVQRQKYGINKCKQLTGREFCGALGSPSAVDLSGDADGVLLTSCQARLGEGGQAALHLHRYLLVTLFLFESHRKTKCS